MRHVNKQPEYRNAVETATATASSKPSWAAEFPTTPIDLKRIAQEASDVYLRNTKQDGLIDGIGWWQCANGYTALALKDLWLNTDANYDSLAMQLRRCEQSNPQIGFVNVYNDDCCWWALCCLHMYSFRKEWLFLEQARIVWKHVVKSMLQPGEQFFRGIDMEGGVYWTSRPGEDSVNSISTGLFAELGVRLALIQTAEAAPAKHEPLAEEYIDIARRSLGWILRCRYQADEGVVLDHVKLQEQKAVDWTFTYNTGVALGTAALLYEATGETEFLTLACHMATKAMTRKQWVEDNGVLTEREAYGRGTHDPRKNNDAMGFKAVLVRQLGTLYSVIVRTRCAPAKAREVAAMIHSFFYINLHSQMESNTDGSGRYGPWWNGPFEYPTSHSQLAVLDVMAAAMLVNFSDSQRNGMRDEKDATDP